ncbi:MAG: ATP-dependent transcriptional regulator, partial [Rhodobacteraceae bacterium]|nr:ATP-dependent transcriptional regulator [Paracoccaceae bacterium]
LIAGLLSIKAQALFELGETEAAQEARLDSLRWARYGFGDSDGALAREQAQIAALMRLEDG